MIVDTNEWISIKTVTLKDNKPTLKYSFLKLTVIIIKKVRNINNLRFNPARFTSHKNIKEKKPKKRLIYSTTNNKYISFFDL